MKLKSLNIFGFKSFADRVHLHYHPGITGVIGPNGSGKSNIIDAVRWVMGEQTAKSLRADDPMDIIFAGSDGRKALGFAEVVLVFENDGVQCPAEYSHLSEISIGRRIYRDGEREYFMNKDNCRLKDIIDFLMAIGLGSKSYSIIQQDKRDRIIQASPEDLREILEETAGITIFKVRRKEAEKRMQSTRDKLENLGNLETELMRQKDALSEQVQKAQEKSQLVSELLGAEVRLAENHLFFYLAQLARVQKEIEALQNEGATQLANTSHWEVEANELKARQLDLTHQIRALEDATDDVRLELAKLRERYSSSERFIEEKKAEQNRIVANQTEEKLLFQTEQEKQEKLQIDIKECEDSIRSLENEKYFLSDQIEEKEEKRLVLRSKKEEISSEIRAIEVAQKDLLYRSEQALMFMEKHQADSKKKEAELQALLKEEESLFSDLKYEQEELRKIQESLEENVNIQIKIQSDLQFLNEEKNLVQNQKDIIKSSYLESKGYLASLAKIMDNQPGIKELSAQLRNRNGEHFLGFIFEKIRFKNQIVEALFEKCLGHILKSIFVSHEENLIDSIDDIETSDIHKAQFFIRSRVHPLSLAEKNIVQEIKSIHGLSCAQDALEWCQDDALETFFERIFVCQDEWIALKAQDICQKNNCQTFIFITERGSLFENNAFISFYGEGCAEGHLLRSQREYEATSQQVQQLTEDLAGVEGQIFQLSEREKALLLEVKNVGQGLDSVRALVMEKEGLLQKIQLNLAHLHQKRTALQKDQGFLSKELEEYREIYLSSQEEASKLTQELNQLKGLFTSFEEEYEDLSVSYDEIRDRLQNKKSEQNIFIERLSHQQKTYEESVSVCMRLSQKLKNYSLQHEESENGIQKIKEETAFIKASLTEKEIDVQQKEAVLKEVIAEEDLIVEKIKVVEEKLRGQKELYDIKQKKIMDKRMEAARYEAICDTAKNEAQEKFGPGFLERFQTETVVTEFDNSQTEYKSIEKTIKELQQKIVEMGPVNERALEEYKDITERYDFLVSQKDDIEKSLLDLESSIQKMEEVTVEKFKEIYEHVNKEFQIIFPILFPGGSAELHLVDEKNLLQTGVEILVRLPGKKLQNMSLFSGGEKALTAISLIFSLLKTTPAPFCFLDEVDAPLDEANVGRFNGVLEALSNEFQFIVITHNRRTMEVLDTIYGISMTEPGVSQLVSVDLSQVPENLRKKQKAAI